MVPSSRLIGSLLNGISLKKPIASSTVTCFNVDLSSYFYINNESLLEMDFLIPICFNNNNLSLACGIPYSAAFSNLASTLYPIDSKSFFIISKLFLYPWIRFLLHFLQQKFWVFIFDYSKHFFI